MKIRHITTTKEFEDLKPIWNSLLAENEVNTVFLTFEWNFNYWKHFQDEISLKILVAEDDAGIQGIAPLQSKKKTVSFISSGLADYSDFIIPKNKEIILTLFLKELHSFQSIRLREIPEKSSTVRILNILYPSLLQTITEKCPAIVFSADDIDSLSKKKDVQKDLKKLHGAGSVEYIEQHDSEVLERYFSCHIHRQESVGHSSMFKDKRYQFFFKELFEQLPGITELQILKLDNKIIAFALSFVYNQVRIGFCKTFDTDFIKYSPGTILMQMTLENSLKNGLKEYDFSRGTETYKFRFSNTLRTNYELYIIHNRIRRTAIKTIFLAKKYAKKVLT